MFFKLNKKLIIIISSVVAIILIGILTYFYNNDDQIEYETPVIINNQNESINNKIYVDIKGAVNKPGVYQVSDNTLVNDVITLAGGLTKNGVTTNINLSKKVTDEMVIYIFTKNELTKVTTTTPIIKTEIIEVNNCIKEENMESSNGLININTASKEELMNVSGIGESKADAIIEYRKTNSFKSIEDIMNISGIGESVFAKIKTYITV